jgi:hypothetical protein
MAQAPPPPPPPGFIPIDVSCVIKPTSKTSSPSVDNFTDRPWRAIEQFFQKEARPRWNELPSCEGDNIQCQEGEPCSFQEVNETQREPVLGGTGDEARWQEHLMTRKPRTQSLEVVKSRGQASHGSTSYFPPSLSFSTVAEAATDFHLYRLPEFRPELGSSTPCLSLEHRLPTITSSLDFMRGERIKLPPIHELLALSPLVLMEPRTGTSLDMSQSWVYERTAPVRFATRY